MAGIDGAPALGAIGDLTQDQLRTQLSVTSAHERRMLAAAIHDDPMQLIVASMLQIDLLRMAPSQDDEEWEKVIGMLETSVERLRRLIDAITSPDLGNGLGDSLHHLAVGIFMGTPTIVRTTGTTALCLPDDQQPTAFRIGQEALVNARRHAHAQAVEVSITAEDDTWVLSVADNGVGCAHLTAGEGRGLAAMRTMAHQIGGRLSVESPPGVGTSVTLVLDARQTRPVSPVGPPLAAPPSSA